MVVARTTLWKPVAGRVDVDGAVGVRVKSDVAVAAKIGVGVGLGVDQDVGERCQSSMNC